MANSPTPCREWHAANPPATPFEGLLGLAMYHQGQQGSQEKAGDRLASLARQVARRGISYLAAAHYSPTHDDADGKRCPVTVSHAGSRHVMGNMASSNSTSRPRSGMYRPSCGSVAATRNKKDLLGLASLNSWNQGTTTGRSRGAASYSRRLAWHGMGEVEGHGLATKGRCVQAGRGSHEHETPLSHQSLHGMEKRRRRCPMEGEHCLRDACEMGREGHFASMEDMASHGAAWSLDGPCS